MTPGPPPKAPQARRRRNTPAGGEWIDLYPLEEPVLPELPGGEWDEDVRELWEAWRKDPATSRYTPADTAFALDTARIYQSLKPLNASAATMLQRRADALGLTPKGKRNLRWRVVEHNADATRPRAPRARKRRHLIAVDPPKAAS
jgi:hypothetical protein